MHHFTSPIRVFVIAPPMLCWGFEKLVQTAYRGIHLTGTAPTLREAMASLAGSRADVAVVDLDEASGAGGDLVQAGRICALLLLASRHDVEAEDCRCEGVTAVVRKHDPPGVLLAALEYACEWGRGRRHRQGAQSQEIRIPEAAGESTHADQARIAALTTRERELIFAVMCHATEPGKVIASRLCISEHTLRNHLTSIYGKLGVRNRLSLHAFAAKHQLDREPGFFVGGHEPLLHSAGAEHPVRA